MDGAGKAILSAIRQHNATHPRDEAPTGREHAAVGGPLPVPTDNG